MKGRNGRLYDEICALLSTLYQTKLNRREFLAYDDSDSDSDNEGQREEKELIEVRNRLIIQFIEEMLS